MRRPTRLTIPAKLSPFQQSRNVGPNHVHRGAGPARGAGPRNCQVGLSVFMPALSMVTCHKTHPGESRAVGLALSWLAASVADGDQLGARAGPLQAAPMLYRPPPPRPSSPNGAWDAVASQSTVERGRNTSGEWGRGPRGASIRSGIARKSRLARSGVGNWSWRSTGRRAVGRGVPVE